MTGEMFRQFGITIALSVLISGAVALSLTPVLCARLIRRKTHHRPNAFFAAFEWGYARLADWYMAACAALIRHPKWSIAGFAACCALDALLFAYVPQGLTPEEDQGYVIAAAMLPDGASMPRTDSGLLQLTGKLLENPDVDKVLTIAGQDLLGGAGNVGNSGAAFIMLNPWEARKEDGQSAFAIANSVFGLGLEIDDGMYAAFNPPAIVGLGTVGGLEGWLQNGAGATPAEMSDVCGQLGQAATGAALASVRCAFSLGAPTVSLFLDVDQARLMGVNVADAYQTLALYLSGVYINDFVQNGRVFRVNMQSEPRFRAQPDDLDHYYVRNRQGEMVPLSNLLRRETGGSAALLTRFNGQPAARLSGQAAAGYSNLDAMNALEDMAKTLPEGYSIGWSGASYQEKTSGGANYMALGLGLLIVFMILSVQFEHFLPPFVAVLSVPFAAGGALLTAWALGFANDVYVQVALVTLIGLSIKNAILIVEFAWMALKEGRNAQDAAMTAAQKRFRPIVMTSLAFILGCVPLVISSGAGAASRHVLGASIIGGMMAATCIAPLFVPAFFALFAKKLRV
jgi:hydrophobe/amphiphile efflux-1 (HAE1) family protein